LVGIWEKWLPYPIKIAESMGGLIGDDFCVISGFANAWTQVTKANYCYNTTDPLAKWRKMDDVPVTGFTHASFATVGKIMYICGSYVGGTPGPDSKICLKYNHAIAPGSGLQWSFLPELPEGRGGGGMNHIKETNSLVYSIGATRRGKTIDYTTTWELFLDNLAGGWIKRADCPYKANHVSHVTAYLQGKPHYYWAGGQIAQEEDSGNQDDLVEWDQATKTWIRRADMPLPRGHASSSTIPYGCGFLMIGGAINTGTKTTNIAWYNIETDKWHSIGDLKNKINTPVCDVVKNLNGTDWIYCQTGSVSGDYTWKSKITL
jgi:N-acetylneuraminic acid mutarotase